MRTRRYSFLHRVFIKLNSILYTSVGKVVDVLTKIGLWGEFHYEIKGHYGDVIHIEHPYPENYQAQHKRHFDEWKEYDTFPHDLFLAKNSWLTSDGIVLKKHRTFINALPHPIFRYQFGFLYNMKIRLFYRKQKTDPDRNYLLLFDNWSWNNYFHWIIDALCRVQLVRDNVKLKFTIVLPEESPKYITETLKLYGYSDFVYLKKRSRTKIGTLYTMNYAAWSGQQHPEILRRMAGQIRDRLGIAKVQPWRKIYVSRGKQFSRRITNENEVLAVLQKHGYETFYFEGMTFADQVKLMTETSHFVTSHGANLTNLIFLPKGARILEMLNDRKPNFCYWSVADSMGHDYRYQLCPIEIADHINVDVKELKKNISEL